VAEVRIRVIRDDGEECDDGQAEFIAKRDDKIERGIVDAALCALHPVDNAFAIFERFSSAPYGDTWIGSVVLKEFG